MHPNIARQLAAERHADLRRESEMHAAPHRLRRRRWLRRRAPKRYAGAPAGVRTGT
jgi:hypothetical protein